MHFTLVVVTHTEVNSIPKENNTTLKSPWELRYRGVCGHTPINANAFSEVNLLHLTGFGAKCQNGEFERAC